MPESTTKSCTTCHGSRPLCPDCKRAKVRAYRAVHRDHLLVLQKESKARGAQHIYDYNKQWVAEHREQTRAYQREYRRLHREQINTLTRKWKRAHPESAVASTHHRKARIKGNGGKYTRSEWQALCAHYDHRCLCCGEKAKLTVDHVVPISKGGLNDILNIQPLCMSCNTKKGDRIIDYRKKGDLKKIFSQATLFDGEV